MPELPEYIVTRIPLEEAVQPLTGPEDEVIDLSTEAGIERFKAEGQRNDSFHFMHERAFGAYVVSWEGEPDTPRGARVAGRVIDFVIEPDIFDTVGILFGSYYPLDQEKGSPQIHEALVLVLTPYDDFFAGPEK